MHSLPFRLAPIALASFSVFAPAVSAQTAEPAQQVTVSGSRTAVNPNTPAATDSIDRSRLADLNIANPEDSIKYLPNIATRKRYIGDRNGAIESRGTNNRMSARGLVLADGVLLSNFLGSQDQIAPRWSMVFPEEIDRVDVIYGPFSALYSGNAIAAAVLFTTRMPKGFEANAGLQLQRQGFDFLGVSKTLQGNLANAFVGDRAGAFSWQIGLSRLDSTSQPTGFATFAPSTTPAAAGDPVVSGAFTVPNRLGQDTVVVGTGGGGIERTKQTNLKLKLAYDITPELQARVTAIRWTNDRQAGAEGDTTWLRDAAGAPVYAGPVSIEGRRYTIAANTFSPRGGEEEHRSLAVMLKSSRKQGWNVDAVLSDYDFAKNLSRTSSTAPPAAFSGGAGTLNRQDGSGWRTLDLKFDRRPGADDSHWPSIGVHWDRFDFRQDNFATADWRSDVPSATSSVVRAKSGTSALFVQDAWQFQPQWKAILGLRAERWRSFEGSSVGGNPASISLPDRSESAWSPKAALEWSPDDAWLVRASLARATRFPTPVELFQGNISAVQQITSNPNLKPERGTFGDVTVERYFPRGSARMTLYHEATRDTLFNQSNASTIPSTSNAQNIDRVRVRGIELAADTRGVLHPQLDLSASVAYNDSRVLANTNVPTTVGKRFAQLPLTRASAIAIWRHSGTLNFSVAVRQSGKQYANLANDDVRDDAFNSLSSFVVVDVRANWQVTPQARVSLGMDNAADKRYFVNHPFPARSLVAELKLGL
jgi:iron complex outermembrane receptor protein